MARTSAEWWAATKSDPERLLEWLRKQYHGEATACLRLRQFICQFGFQCQDPKHLTAVSAVADQEQDHANWIWQLLEARGEAAELIDGKTERYWDRTLGGIVSWETGCAVAAHAEKMRLDRIRAIVADPDAPDDVRNTFMLILPQEEWHEKLFRTITTPEAMGKTESNHQAGAEALGLVN